jgi:subtilisin family serine protease
LLEELLVRQVDNTVLTKDNDSAAVLDLVNLRPLMELSDGRPEITIGLIDGPVARDHQDLAGAHIREIPRSGESGCSVDLGAACRHGTFVAGILVSRRGCGAPAICPNCTLLVRPIFSEAVVPGEVPSAEPQYLAEAIIECIRADARVLNISAAITQPGTRGERDLTHALGEAARRGVIVVAAAGNQGSLGCTVITGDPWVIPVVAYEAADKPLRQSNLGASIGRNGIGAPGAQVTSLGAGSRLVTGGGTSAAAAFVTGTVALLCSRFPQAPPAMIRLAIASSQQLKRTTVVPPLLNAWTAYQALLKVYQTKRRP